MAFRIFFVYFCVVATAYSQSAIPRKLGEFRLPAAAFIEVFDDNPNATNVADRYTLYISTFNPINGNTDPKYYLRAPGRYLNDVASWTMQELDRTAFWPNNPDEMPEEVAGVKGIAWTSGFLVPGKQHGALELYDTSKEPPVGPVNITAKDTTNWSYHRVLWKDMDNDGDLDALTARFFVPILGAKRTELLWLENPGVPFAEMPTTGWEQHILHTDSTDVHFRNFKLTSKGVEYDCLLSAEFWKEQLHLYFTVNGDWRDWTNVRKIPIDITLGQSFDVYVDDFNMDGKIDLMATAYNHTLGHVFVWEVPDDFRNGTFVKHVIADQFRANAIIGGQSMTPGSPKPFYPSEAYKNEVLPGGRRRKPYIMVSGDDDGRHYILEPMSEDPTDWRYTKHTLVDTLRTTSGKFACVDLDGDGYTEIIAAGYTSGTIYVYTYAPQ